MRMATTRIIPVILAGATVVVLILAPPAVSSSRARAVLRDVNGAEVGTVSLRAHRDDVRVKVEVELSPTMAGFHGFHIHAVGLCDPATAFTSAGAHLGSSQGQSHPHHNGDLPSLLVKADGTAELEVRTDRTVLDDIFDGDGAAVVVHADPDNFANVPTRYAPGGPDAATSSTGDSGARLACGVLD